MKNETLKKWKKALKQLLKIKVYSKFGGKLNG